MYSRVTRPVVFVGAHWGRCHIHRHALGAASERSAALANTLLGKPLGRADCPAAPLEHCCEFLIALLLWLLAIPAVLLSQLVCPVADPVNRAPHLRSCL